MTFFPLPLKPFFLYKSRVNLIFLLSTFKPDPALLYNQRPAPPVKPLSSYTAMKWAAAVTLDQRDGNHTMEKRQML